MGRSPYQSEKRRKELARLKKQEEKRQRRFNKKHEQDKTEGQPGDMPAGGPETEAPSSQEGASGSGAPQASDQGSSPVGGGGTEGAP